MNEIITERSEGILRVQLNRPARKNAMTSAMYITLADLFNSAMKDDQVRVVLWHAAGDSFTAGNDLEDFIKNPPGPGESSQSRLINALIDFEKPIVVAVQGAVVGGGTTILTHCDFVYAGESSKFQLPFINLALVPEFGSSYALPARAGYLQAADAIFLGRPFDAKKAAQMGLVTEILPDEHLLETAIQTAQKLAERPADALQACKRLMRRSVREQLKQAAKLENEEFSIRVRSDETKEAISAFFEKRSPNFANTKGSHSLSSVS